MSGVKSKGRVLSLRPDMIDRILYVRQIMTTAKDFARSYVAPPTTGFLLTGGLVVLITGSWQYAFGVIRGPFAGAVARDWQSCCADSSWSIAPYAISSVAFGLAVQLLFHPQSRVLSIGRSVIWWASS